MFGRDYSGGESEPHSIPIESGARRCRRQGKANISNLIIVIIFLIRNLNSPIRDDYSEALCVLFCRILNLFNT